MNDTLEPELITPGWDFDFVVDNPIDDTAGVQLKYNIDTLDVDFITDAVPSDPPGDSYSEWETWSDQRYLVQRTKTVKKDTLWLRARDFAAHAVVMALADRYSATPLRVRGRKNKYANNAPIYSVTVPRDYDGYQTGGVNRGDFMADRWEESVFSLPSCDSSTAGIAALTGFNPFLNLDSSGTFSTDSIADRDTLAVGRGIRGDGLTNWEEYRGFWVTGDYHSYPYATHQFQRMDPRHKNVFKALSPRLEADLVSVMPAWDSLLYKPKFKSTDTTEFFDIKYVNLKLQSGIRDTSRFQRGMSPRIGRMVNLNIAGASFKYYGYYTPTRVPVKYYQDAVTFWEINRNDRLFMEFNGFNGYCFPHDSSESFDFPNNVSRVVLNKDEISSKGTTLSYYNGGLGTGTWLGANGDYRKILRYILTHEFGHAIGRIGHNSAHTIMWSDSLLGSLPQDTAQGPNRGKYFYDPNWKNDFNTTDKSRITIQKKELK